MDFKVLWSAGQVRSPLPQVAYGKLKSQLQQHLPIGEHWGQSVQYVQCALAVMPTANRFTDETVLSGKGRNINARPTLMLNRSWQKFPPHKEDAPGT